MCCLFNSFRLELEVEPIFASMALYDAKERKKVILAVEQFIRICFRKHQPGHVAQSVTCLTADPGVFFYPGPVPYFCGD